jgi:DNA-binding beta-propeller fold protein YncE
MVTTMTSSLGAEPVGITYDGERIWTANTGSVSIVTLLEGGFSVTNKPGFTQALGCVFDGTNVWVTDDNGVDIDNLHKLDSAGNILMSVNVGSRPVAPAFDGMNIWVPNFDNDRVSVVRAVGSLSGTVLTTLSDRSVSFPIQAAFDGERVMVVNFDGTGVSLWKATDFTKIGSLPVGGAFLNSVCSDGIDFWITAEPNRLIRF